MYSVILWNCAGDDIIDMCVFLDGVQHVLLSQTEFFCSPLKALFCDCGRWPCAKDYDGWFIFIKSSAATAISSQKPQRRSVLFLDQNLTEIAGTSDVKPIRGLSRNWMRISWVGLTGLGLSKEILQWLLIALCSGVKDESNLAWFVGIGDSQTGCLTPASWSEISRKWPPSNIFSMRW